MKLLNILAQKKFLIALAVVNVLIILILGYLKGNIQTLDTKFLYMKSEIQPLFMTLGEEGRAQYIKVNIADFCFIFFYTLFLLGMYVAFFKDLAKSLIVIPILLAAADFVETSTIFYLLNKFPESHNGLEYMLMFLTPAKWMLALSALLVIVNGYFVNLYMKKS